MVDKQKELENLVKDLYFFNFIHSFQMNRAVIAMEALRNHYGDEIIEFLHQGEDAWKEALGFYMKQSATLINMCKEKYGDEVIEILKKLDYEDRFNMGKDYAASRGNNSLEDLIPFFCESTVAEKGDDYIIFRRCENYCRVGVLAKELGISDLMYDFHCAGDPPFIEGFNPDLACEVRKSVMYDDCCEHLIYYKK